MRNGIGLVAFGLFATTSVLGVQRVLPDQVSLNVTVSDDSSNSVTGLGAGDFSVLEDGVKQDLTSVSRPIDVPIVLALLLDTSASGANTLATAQTVAIDFARRLRAQDVAEVVDFDSRVTVVQPFTNSATELEQAIRKTSAGGSTSLFNALFITLRELKKIGAANAGDIRRQAIVVMSDGEDTSSLVPFKDVLDLAQRSDPSIYAVSLNDGRRIRGERELRELVEKTGGQLFSSRKSGELGKIADQLLDDVRGQYTVRYASKNSRRDGRWRRVEVRVNRPKAKVRTRPGYFA